MAPTFRWTCSFLSVMDYEVRDGGEPYLVQVRRGATDYERSISTRSPEDWEREVVAGIGLLRRSHNSDRPIPAETVRAFNRWRATEHASSIAILRADPERYGPIDEILADPAFAPPPPVSGAHWDRDRGWIIDTPAEPVPAAA